MGVVPIDLVAACAAIEAVADQLAGVVRSVPDTAAQISGMEWTVGETAAHLVIALRGFAGAAAGRHVEDMEAYDPAIGVTQMRLAAGNASTLKQVPHDDGEKLADLIHEGTRAFLDASEGRRGNEPVHTPWYGEKDIHTQASAAGMVLGELLVHGYDIASAVDSPWEIRPEHARLVLAAIPMMFPLYVDAGVANGISAAFDISVRGGPRYVVYVTDSTARVQPFSSQPVDCHLSADPVALLLITYGRVNQWGQIARGRLVTWGRKPWLGLKLRSLFLNP